MVLSNSQESDRMVVVGEEAAKGLADNLPEEWDVRLLSNDEEIADSPDSAKLEIIETGELLRPAVERALVEGDS